MSTELTELVVENEKLLYSIIHKYFPHYPNKEDLLQVGSIGLLKAYQNFDPTKGAKLTTYAYPYIYGEMKKYVREDRGIKVSRDLSILNLKLDRASLLLTQSLHREPTPEELSQYLGISEYEIMEARCASIPIQSIDEPINQDGKEMTLHDTIADHSQTDIDLLLMLRSELTKLPRNEQELIEHRYMADMTQIETARSMGMSQVQVSRSESKVLSKLRNKMMS